MQLVERVQREIRVDRARAVPYQQREMVDFASIPGLHNQPDARPSPLSNQVVM